MRREILILIGVLVLGGILVALLFPNALTTIIAKVRNVQAEDASNAVQTSEHTAIADAYVSFGDNAKKNDSAKVISLPSAVGSNTALRVFVKTGENVEFLIIANGEDSCDLREYKIDFGDGTIDWLGIDSGSCAQKAILYMHSYRNPGTYKAVLHDTTDLQYHESGFTTSKVSNPVSTVTVNVR